MESGSRARRTVERARTAAVLATLLVALVAAFAPRMAFAAGDVTDDASSLAADAASASSLAVDAVPAADDSPGTAASDGAAAERSDAEKLAAEDGPSGKASGAADAGRAVPDGSDAENEPAPEETASGDAAHAEAAEEGAAGGLPTASADASGVTATDAASSGQAVKPSAFAQVAEGPAETANPRQETADRRAVAEEAPVQRVTDKVEAPVAQVKAAAQPCATPTKAAAQPSAAPAKLETAKPGKSAQPAVTITAPTAKVSVQTRASTLKTYTVRFYDAYGNIAKVQEVQSGKSAKAPKLAAMKGRIFKRWDTSYKKVKANLYVHPVFKDRKKVYILSVDSSYAPKSGSVSAEYGTIEWTRWTAGTSIVAGDSRFFNADSGTISGWYTKPNGQGRYIAYGDTFKMPKRDLVLYPAYVYKANSEHYTVTYNSNRDGVTSFERGGIYAGTTIQLPRTWSQDRGYTLIGYNTKKSGKGSFYALGSVIDMPKRDLKLYGVWMRNKIRIRVNPNYSGSGAVPASYYVPVNVSIPIDNFTGIDTRDSKSPTWKYVLNTLSTKKFGRGAKYRVYGTGYFRDTVYLDIAKSGFTLYANWREANKKVTINPNGGMTENPDYYVDPATNEAVSSSNYVSRNHVKGDLVALPAADAFSRAGYILTGYSTVKGGSAAYFPKQYVELSKNLKLYAVWSKAGAKNVSFTFDPSYAGEKAYTEEIAVAPGFEMPVPSDPWNNREGNYFVGWTTDREGKTVQYVPGNTWTAPLEAVALYAVWSKAAVLTFNYNFREATSDDDSYLDEPVSQNYTIGTSYIDRSAPNRADYVFVGWNTRPDGNGKMYDPDTQITLAESDTTTLYAMWLEKDATLTLDNNFKDKGAAGSVKAEFTIAKGITLGDNYSNGSAYPSSSFFADHTAREGYSFDGWATKADGSGKRYATSRKLDNMKVRGNVRLYAQWRKLPKVTFVKGKKEVVARGFATTDGAHTLRTLDSDKGFAKKGYALVGWNTMKNGKGENFVVGEAVRTMPVSKVVLYPQFEKVAKKTAVTFVSEGKTVKAVKAVGKSFNLLRGLANVEEPAREGYVFDGWNTKKNGTGDVYPNHTWTDNTIGEDGVKSDTYGHTFGSVWVPKKGLKLYAQWERAITLTIDPNYDGATASWSQSKRMSAPAESVGLRAYSSELQRAGYELLGWSTDKSAKIATYPASGSYWWGGSDVTLYAVWSQTI